MKKIAFASLVMPLAFGLLSSVGNASTVTSCTDNSGQANGTSTAACGPESEAWITGFYYSNGGGSYGFSRSSSSVASASDGLLQIQGNAQAASITTGAVQSTTFAPYYSVTGSVSALATFSDTFTVQTAMPTSGEVIFTDLVTASMLSSGAGTYGVEPGSANGMIFDSVYGPQSVANGAELFTFAIPFVSSKTSNITVALLANYDCVTNAQNSSCSDSFVGASVITGYTVETSAGAPLAGTVTFGSGTNYDDLTGATPTPEPSSFLLFGSGLVGLGGMIRRKLKA